MDRVFFCFNQVGVKQTIYLNIYFDMLGLVTCFIFGGLNMFEHHRWVYNVTGCCPDVPEGMYQDLFPVSSIPCKWAMKWANHPTKCGIFRYVHVWRRESILYHIYPYIYNYIWRHEHSSTCETMLPCYRPCYLGALCCIDLVGWCLTRGILLAMGPGPSVIAGSQNTLWQIC